MEEITDVRAAVSPTRGGILVPRLALIVASVVLCVTALGGAFAGGMLVGHYLTDSGPQSAVQKGPGMGGGQQGGRQAAKGTNGQGGSQSGTSEGQVGSQGGGQADSTSANGLNPSQSQQGAAVQGN